MSAKNTVGELSVGRGLVIALDGPVFPRNKFLNIVNLLFSVLDDIDKETSSDGKATVEWSVFAVDKGSLEIGVESSPKIPDIGFQRGVEINRIFAYGIESLARSHEIPKGFTKKSINKVVSLLNQTDPDDVSTIRFSSGSWKFTDLSAVANNVIKYPTEVCSFWGGIEGRLVTLDAEKTIKFGLRSGLQLRLIHCLINDEELYEIALKAIRKRVYIYGQIRQSVDSQKLNILARDIEILPDEDELPTSAEILARLRG